MPEEKLLFVEKELKRWKRPESPKLGTALVFIGGKKPVVVYEGERGPTQGELLWGKYNTFYEVDMGDRSLELEEKLPFADGLEFRAKVELTYAVSDPALIVNDRITDAGQLKKQAIKVMRRTSREYTYEQIGEAENIIAAIIKDEVREKGFKPIISAFVEISGDKEISQIKKIV
ncbi:SPFH domain-containing protein [Okeania sp. KiyG1]|uniref:SPFH domain-containing protein n=1 Tax=Okeania sp. KiyG1 TaxID=2720165 RepID=UPI001922BA16|nr:SPFH domain-containing protein [Okeania sp. KiyG1]GGA15385.1 hypothetical protein CYANOKiyG1_29390 [Okeania sp. KiyG1]